MKAIKKKALQLHVAIIPGPQEPSRDVNPFLDPLMNEIFDC